MTISKRLVDPQSDADDFERAVLRSELDAAPPTAAESYVLSRVMAAVAPVGPGPSGPVAPATGGAVGTGASVKGAATLGGLGKGFALGIGVSIAAATGSHFLRETSPPREASSAIATVHAPPTFARAPAPDRRLEAPVEALPSDSRAVSPPRSDGISTSRVGETIGAVPVPTALAPPERTPGAASVASFPVTEGVALAASRLKEEAALLARARAELRAGALAAAFATLEASRQKFTAPELFQEREALAIELLYRSGEHHAAASRAREFLARFPESPHAAAVRAFADDTRR